MQRFSAKRVSRIACGVYVSSIVFACGGSEATAPTPPPPGNAVPRVSLAAVAGNWTGTAAEIRTTNKYRVSVTINDSARVGEQGGVIDYDSAGFVTSISFACGGELTLTAADQGAYTFGERITRGGPCINNGSVTVTRNQDGLLDWKWFGPAGLLSVTATLTKVP
jgi:hypothetical protein